MSPSIPGLQISWLLFMALLWLEQKEGAVLSVTFQIHLNLDMTRWSEQGLWWMATPSPRQLPSWTASLTAFLLRAFFSLGVGLLMHIHSLLLDSWGGCFQDFEGIRSGKVNCLWRKLFFFNTLKINSDVQTSILSYTMPQIPTFRLFQSEFKSVNLFPHLVVSL
jgi:hypothetical protein